MEKRKKNFKKTAFGALLVALMFIGLMTPTILTNIQNKPDVENAWEWFKAPMVLATNNTVADGSSGIVDIYIMNTAFSSWNAAIDEDDANIYEETDGTFTDNSAAAPHEALTGTTPYETDFYIVVVYQFTPSQAKDGGSWNSSRVKAYMNTTGCQDGNAASCLMQEGTFYAGAGANSQRINFYLTDTDGAGGGSTNFQVAIDATYSANCTIWYKG